MLPIWKVIWLIASSASCGHCFSTQCATTVPLQCHYIGGRRPKLTPEQWAQAGCLIRAGVPRQQVVIIYDAGLSTLYRKFPVLG
ncbi:helix-turn-helix domain-containing protein [Salmonella enterica]|nr:Hin recombinase [Salmonella enterica subsp. enterica serovar Enteritidis]EAR0174149.1 Hin recombinase [Salmonella enterica]EBZ0424018.1 Hin recombinase [Salmonella enterica subsp. enterica serovar Newport]EAV7543068.1 Hin recombinase [Salmonella enterica]EDB6441972.1 helix-turn-helix domain-containing protein [Salmonella enterica subsp. enterica serovar Newport]